MLPKIYKNYLLMKKINKFIVISINCFILVIFFSNIHGYDDLHSSITALEEVFQTEKLYIENMEIYLDYSTRILNAMKGKLSAFKANQMSSSYFKDELSLGQKINYHNIMNYIFESNYIGFSKNISLFKDEYKFPNDVDLEGVTRGLHRLQDVYNYTAKELATEAFIKIENMTSTNITKLTSPDCFEIAYKLDEIGNKYESREWYDLAYDLYDGNKNLLKKPWNISTILQYNALAKYRQGNLNESVRLIEEAIKTDSKDERLLNLLGKYKYYLEILENFKSRKTSNQKLRENYKEGCRGDFQKPPDVLKKLYCTYKYGQHPFLKLAPVKVEIQNFDPYIAIFYDVLYDNEIKILKDLSTDKLSRAFVWNATAAERVLSHIRTSKYGWLYNEDHPVLEILDQRMADMSDLSMETSEPFQIMNYGIGGHYEYHQDFLDEPNEFNNAKAYGYDEWGNRIATILFYMSDVEQGGATVYPYIATAVRPQKGTAAFWFNMFPRGESDWKTTHAACPVIVGSKWVINKWIRYNGQIFLRPCRKDKDEYYHTFNDI